MHPQITLCAPPDLVPGAALDAVGGVEESSRRGLSEVVALLGGIPGDSGDAGVPVALRRVMQGAALLLEGAESGSLYIVRSGSLKSFRTLEDGYEQVIALAQIGELLGAEALHGGRQPATVVALEDSTVYVLPVRDLPILRRQDSQLDFALERALSRQLVRAAETTAMAAAVASEVRLARFLIWLSGRMSEIGQSPHRLLLRMGRREIASLLCVAHETVSRAFTTLAEQGLLRVDRRDVHLLDLGRLRELARCTRGLPQDGAAAKRCLHQAGLPSTWYPAMPSLAPVAA
jgi:CRP/FNR family transcriptional regulator